MQFSSIVITLLAATASALPRSATSHRRASSSLWPTVSDPGFYAAAQPPDYSESQILQWNIDDGSSTGSLVAQFPEGFAVTQSGPAKLNVYTRTSAGTGSYVGTFGPLPVAGGLVTEDVYIVIADITISTSFALEFQIDSDTENASISFFNTDEAGFFVVTGTA